jgi:hypothetical protein
MTSQDLAIETRTGYADTGTHINLQVLAMPSNQAVPAGILTTPVEVSLTRRSRAGGELTPTDPIGIVAIDQIATNPALLALHLGRLVGRTVDFPPRALATRVADRGHLRNRQPTKSVRLNAVQEKKRGSRPNAKESESESERESETGRRRRRERQRKLKRRNGSVNVSVDDRLVLQRVEAKTLESRSGVSAATATVPLVIMAKLNKIAPCDQTHLASHLSRQCQRKSSSMSRTRKEWWEVGSLRHLPILRSLKRHH